VNDLTFSDVAVVIITRNEEKSIAKVVRDVQNALPGVAVYVVDDSTDNTKEIAIACGAIVSDGPRRGFGPAFHQALLTPQEPIVATIDADNTYPAEAFPALIDLIRNGSDVAGANRLGFGRPSAMPLQNYMSNVILSRIASIRSRQNILDVHSGQRAYRRQVLHDFRWSYDFDAFPIDLVLIPAFCGLKVVEIPIEYRERIGVTTLRRWSSGKASLKRVLRSKRSILRSKLQTSLD
jgi:glycosyltransferase involved in cell wall biosynthesis